MIDIARSAARAGAASAADRPPVIVVGAGPGGLSVSAALRRLRIRAVVLEQAAAPAATWRAGCDRLRLNTSRLTSRLPRASYGRGAALFPSRDEFVAYLDAYAERERVDIRLARGWTASSATGADGACGPRQASWAPRMSSSPPAMRASRSFRRGPGATASRAGCCTLPSTAMPSPSGAATCSSSAADPRGWRSRTTCRRTVQAGCGCPSARLRTSSCGTSAACPAIRSGSCS